MNQFGLIGFPLGHSFSPAYFRDKFERENIAASYEALPLERISDFSNLLKEHPFLKGLNVTTPYKTAVIPFLNDLNAAAKSIGAVNCIRIIDGKLKGYNTDWLGFRDSIQPLLQAQHTAALVLGNGGASLAVRYALQQMNIPFITVSATPGKADYLYQELDDLIISRHPIIINTTILGTEGLGCPELPYAAISKHHLLYDLVYNPPLTPFLKEGKMRGASIKNGQEMLEIQAAVSWEIWQEASNKD